MDRLHTIMHARERVWMHRHAAQLYSEQGMQLEREAKKPKGPPAALWPYTPPVPFIPRRHHLGSPDGIRLAEIRAEKERARSLQPQPAL